MSVFVFLQLAITMTLIIHRNVMARVSYILHGPIMRFVKVPKQCVYKTETTDRPSAQNCMLGLSHDQVWMGSKDSIIYIIDTVSMSCNQQLTEHRQEVTSLAADPQPQNGRWGLFSCLSFHLLGLFVQNVTPPLHPPPPHPHQSAGVLLQQRRHHPAVGLGQSQSEEAVLAQVRASVVHPGPRRSAVVL